MIYLSLQLMTYYDDMNNPILKSILLPIEAWTTFMSQLVPRMDKASNERDAKEPRPTETATSMKRSYSHGNFTLSIFYIV